MPHKDLATVRVSNIPSSCRESELLHFFANSKAKKAPKASLCPSSCMPDAALTATVTFGSQSDAKEALNLNGNIFRGRNISVDREFMGLTVLAAPPNSKVE